MLISLHWSAAYSGPAGTNEVGWGLPNGGWPVFIRSQIIPAIEWAQSCGHTPMFTIHHPFGQYHDLTGCPNQHIDGYDYAKQVGRKYLTNGFSTKTGFKRVTSDFNFYGYVGGLDPDPRLKAKPLAERVAITLRNVKPFVDAGFAGMFVDVAENAINKPFVSKFTPRQNSDKSVDCTTLALLDELFPHETGVEAAPRAFDVFAPLQDRPIHIMNEEYVFRFGSKYEAELKKRFKYRGRNSNHVALGYDATTLPYGPDKVIRTIEYSDNVKDSIDLIGTIVEDGHVPGFNPQPFIKQGVKL